MQNMALWSTATAAVTGFVLCAVATGIMRRIAVRIDFVDRPGGHKSHSAPIALGGGVAIAGAMLLPLIGGFAVILLFCGEGRDISWMPDALQRHVPGLLSKASTALVIAGGAAVLHVVGLIDDRRHLSPWTKLGFQIVVAGVLVLALDLRLMTFLGAVPSCAITLAWIIVVTNAFNLLDNMDGLCAGVAAIAATVFAIAALRSGQLFVPTLAFLLTGVMLGFLLFNFPPARIFMGDAGSLVVGYFMAVLTVLTTYWDSAAQDHLAGVFIPLVVLAVPLYDTASVVVIRLRLGINPLRGDQRHFSHRLVKRGLSPRNAVLTIYLATLATTLGAMALPDATWPVVAVVVCQCLCVVMIIAILESTEHPHEDDRLRS